MEKWVKIVFIIIGISLVSAIYNLIMWKPESNSSLLENYHSILFGISILVFVVTAGISSCIFAGQGEGGY